MCYNMHYNMVSTLEPRPVAITNKSINRMTIENELSKFAGLDKFPFTKDAG